MTLMEISVGLLSEKSIQRKYADFGSEWSLAKIAEKIAYPSIITGAAVGGIACVVAGVSIWQQRRYKKRGLGAKVATLEASSPGTDSSSPPVVSQAGQMHHNAFGMTSPIASPGTVGE